MNNNFLIREFQADKVADTLEFSDEDSRILDMMIEIACYPSWVRTEVRGGSDVHVRSEDKEV